MDDLVERLLAKRRTRVRYGGTLTDDDYHDIPVNPDGLDAVVALAAKDAEIARLREALKDAENARARKQAADIFIQCSERVQAAEAESTRLKALVEEAESMTKLALEYWAHRQQRYKNRSPVWVEDARAFLAKLEADNG